MTILTSATFQIFLSIVGIVGVIVCNTIVIKTVRHVYHLTLRNNHSRLLELCVVGVDTFPVVVCSIIYENYVSGPKQARLEMSCSFLAKD